MLISKDLAYLLGVIYGDGHIKNGTKSKTDLSTDYKIGIEITDIKYLQNTILPLFKIFTNTEAKISIRKRKNRKKTGILEVRNKQFFLRLTEKIKTHKGPKTKNLKIPSSIKNLPLEIKNEFIAGYFDTDGGFRGKTLGITTNSKYIQNFFCTSLDLNNILYYRDSWINQKYNETYYGVHIKKDNIDIFLKTFKLRNPEKLASIKARFSCTGAGVVKRAG